MNMNKQSIIGDTRDTAMRVILYDVSLNRYDRKFITNINNKYITKDRPITQKQSDVFDTIITKYKKQLKTLGVYYKDILALKWRLPIITDGELLNSSYFKITNNKMRLHFKFNRDLIKEVRALVYDDDREFINKHRTNSQRHNIKYQFEWNNKTMEWVGEFNVYLFKKLYDFAIKYTINIDVNVKALYNNCIKEFGTKEEWTPSLHIVNNHLYINCIVDNMNIDFNNTDLSDENITRICMLNAIGEPMDHTCKNTSVEKEVVNRHDNNQR